MSTQRITPGALGRAALMLIAAGALVSPAAAGTPIGLAVSNGAFQIDHARVTGNTTLFDGSLIETGATVSQLQMGGVRMRLAAQTRARVYRQKTVLESGYGQLESAAGYEVEARSLRISSGSADSVALIRLKPGRKVTVAAARGAVRVANAAGVVVANLESGASLDFEPQDAGAAAPTRISGCLLEKSGKWILAEQTTNVVLELQGAGLAAEVGNKVDISGAPAGGASGVAGASQTIRVAAIRRLSKGGCSSTAKRVGAAAVSAGAAGAAAAGGTGTASGAGAAAAAAGVSSATVAVVGGVAAAATVGGLAAVGELPGQGDEPPPAASR